MQVSVKIDTVGSEYFYDKDDFGDITLQSVIDACNFNTTTTPIEMKIQEFDDK